MVSQGLSTLTTAMNGIKTCSKLMPICGTRRLSHTTRHLQCQAPVFSVPSKGSELTSILQALIVPNGRWSLSINGRGLERAFKFNTFRAAWTFMTKVADECTTARHHPEWANVYNSVLVRWTTHNPSGLSGVDLEMAGFCDRLASKHETSDTVSSDDAGKLGTLADGAAKGAAADIGKPEKEKELQKQKEAIEREEKDDPDGPQGSIAGIGGQPS